MFVYCLFLECPLHGAMTVFFCLDAALRLSAWDPAPEGGSVPSHLLNDSMSFPAVEETEAALCCGGGACPGPALGPAPRSNQLLPLFSLELAWGSTVLFLLASLAFSAAVAKTRSGGTAERRSGAPPCGTSPTALGGSAGHAQSAGPLQLSE